MWDRAWLQSLLQRKGAAESLGRKILFLLLAYSSLKYLLSRRSRPQLVDACTAESKLEKVEDKGRTLLGQSSFQFLLAFIAGWFDVVCFKQYKCYANMMTGNTVNLCYKIGGLELDDIPFLTAAIAHFCSGFTAFKCLDMKLKSRGSCAAVAPLILALFASADVLRAKHPNSRWHMLPLALAGGMINSISAEKGKIVTNMMTGHFQSLCNILADLLVKGATPQQRASARDSLRMVATFCSGICIGMAAWNSPHPLARALAGRLRERRFAAFGAAYAAVLLLHDLPAPRPAVPTL